MKFLIKDEIRKEKSIEIWLEQFSCDDSVSLMGKDSTGRERIIMDFNDGQFYRYTSAELEGLITNEVGRIKEEK